MFRAAAVVFLFFGVIWIWRFGFTDYRADLKLYGIPAGVVSLIVGVLLLRLQRVAIGISAAAAAFVGICAAVFAPNSVGPAILFLAGLALACVIYAALAIRVIASGDEGSRS
jgi:hypothetical protein